MNHYKYLPVTLKKIWSPYGLIYLPFMVVTVLSDHSPLEASLWYWLICGSLFLAEYFGAYWTLENGTLTKRFFFSKFSVPIQKVTRIIKGPPFGLSRTAPMYCYYQNEKGEEKYIFAVLVNHDSKEVAKFIADIVPLNPKIVIDHQLKVFLGQEGIPMP